ncbi:TlpA family protein disulfide reductase [Pseudoalteromonas ulvae]|nr:TlpA disulfide reductase family protein [Pseudoalteromonas ulvae]
MNQLDTPIKSPVLFDKSNNNNQKRTPKMKLMMILLAGLTLTACSQIPSTLPANNPQYQTYVNAGDSFEQRTFVSISDENIDLNTIEKRKLIVYFATWCHDSQRTMSQIMSSPLASDKHLQIIGIGREENVGNLKKFQQDYQLNFPLVSDQDRHYYNQVANAGIPRLILLDEANEVVKTVIGEMPNAIDHLVW